MNFIKVEKKRRESGSLEGKQRPGKEVAAWKGR